MTSLSAFSNRLGFGIVLLLAGAGSAAAQCEIQKRHVLRVALSVAAGETPLDKRVMTVTVEQLWAPEGFGIDWIDETVASRDDRLDAWVVVTRRSVEAVKPGERTERDNLRSPRIVLIAADEVESRVTQGLSLQLQVPPDTVRHLMFGDRHLFERSLGYTIAHRLGHTVMGLSHAATGLMSRDYLKATRSGAFLQSRLDAVSRKSLQKRFGLGCAENERTR